MVWVNDLWHHSPEVTRGPALAGLSARVSNAGKAVLNHEASQLLGDTEAVQVGVIQHSRGKVTLVMQSAGRNDAGALALTKQGETKQSINTTKILKDKGLARLFGTAEGVPEQDAESGVIAISLQFNL